MASGAWHTVPSFSRGSSLFTLISWVRHRLDNEWQLLRPFAHPCFDVRRARAGASVFAPAPVAVKITAKSNKNFRQ